MNFQPKFPIRLFKWLRRVPGCVVPCYDPWSLIISFISPSCIFEMRIYFVIEVIFFIPILPVQNKKMGISDEQNTDAVEV